MVEIKFSGNSTENLHRQIAAYLERIEMKEVPKRGGRHEKKQSPGSADSNLGEEQR